MPTDPPTDPEHLDPIRTATIGGFPVEYFTAPGDGEHPLGGLLHKPLHESVLRSAARVAEGGEPLNVDDLAAHAAVLLAEKALAHGIILSAIVRELLAQRAELVKLVDDQTAALQSLRRQGFDA